jgi:hypothetical protein
MWLTGRLAPDHKTIDEDIDREFNAVCQTIWGFTLDDFDDDCLVKADHNWLDELTVRRAYPFLALRFRTKRSAKAEAKKDKPAASRDRERAMNREVASGTISLAFD